MKGKAPELKGGYIVPNFDGKAEMDQYFKSLKIPTTFLLLSFFYENLITHGMGNYKLFLKKYFKSIFLSSTIYNGIY
jgi:hypothetical protein